MHIKFGAPSAVKTAPLLAAWGLFMKKVNCILKKTFFLVLIAAILASSCSLGAFAAYADYKGPSISGIDLDITRSVITLTFDQEIEAAVSSFNGRIKISKDGKALETLPSSTKVSISGFRMTISLASPLDTPDNFVYVTEGTLARQDIPVESSLFDARGPELSDTKPVTLSDSGSKVTIRFKTEVRGYPNDDTLKNGYISLARNGSSFNEIIPAEDIEVDTDNGQIIIELDEPLSGTRSKFKILAGTLTNATNGNINLKDIVTSAINASNSTSSGYTDDSDMPAIKSTSISSDLRTVTVYFTQKIKNAFATSGTSASLAQTFLRSHIKLSRGNLNNFEILGGGDTVTVGSNYVKIVFAEPLLDKSNYILFDEDSLTDYNGNPLTQDLITNSVTDSSTADSSVPQYSSVSASGTNKIKIYFTLPIIKRNSLSATKLLSSISVSRNGSAFKSLTSHDSVTFSSSTMTITLDEPLTGSRNRVRIAADTLTSKVGVPISKSITTDYFSALSSSDEYDDYYAPEYKSVSYDADASRIRIYFENDIKATSSANLLSSISISRNGSTFKTLSYNDVVTISPRNAISILLDEPLTGTRNRVKINANTLADYETGYVLNEAVTTEYFSADSSDSTDDDDDNTTSTGSISYSGNISASLSDDFYTVTLKFDEPFYNSFETLDELKEKIQISRIGKFTSLTSDDYIRLDEANNELLIVLAKPAEEYFSQIRILARALTDDNGKVLSNSITTLPLGEAEGDARAYANDEALFIPIETEENSSSVVATLSDDSVLSSLPKTSVLLIKLPATKNSATLNISSSVVSKMKSLNGTFALSYGNSTYYLPASNVSSLASGDTLSLKIAKVSSAAQSLNLAASSNSFSTEVSATSLTANVISASGGNTPVKHAAFAKKRFLVEEKANETFYTAVRIEDSGAVVPVPTNNDSSNGVLYLTAKTLEDGNYAAISAVHTFTNTPAWVTLPANTLGSKLILANTKGSDLNASQAISRAETVTIMSKTLGVFGDATGASPFFDMLPTDSYFNAVMSAVSYSLISGYPDGTFKPSGSLTRAEAMTIVARAMRFLNGKSVSQSSEMSASEATSILSKFTDAGTVDNWAKADIAECVQAGVVNGDNHGRLNPKSKVTRAELIQLMYNLLNKAKLL